MILKCDTIGCPKRHIYWEKIQWDTISLHEEKDYNHVHKETQVIKVYLANMSQNYAHSRDTKSFIEVDDYYIRSISIIYILTSEQNNILLWRRRPIILAMIKKFEKYIILSWKVVMTWCWKIPIIRKMIYNHQYCFDDHANDILLALKVNCAKTHILHYFLKHK